MPTYDYRCDACGAQFELYQSIKADPVKTCAKCGADQARRVIGAGGGFIFKGSGFYITDYTRSKDYQEKAKADTGSAKPVEAPKTDTKPASAPAPAAAPASPTPASGGTSSGGSSGGSGSSAKASAA